MLFVLNGLTMHALTTTETIQITSTDRGKKWHNLISAGDCSGNQNQGRIVTGKK